MKRTLLLAALFYVVTGHAQNQPLPPAIFNLQTNPVDTSGAPNPPAKDSTDQQIGFRCFTYDKLAVPVNGNNAFQKYLMHNVSYPIQALNRNITGRVEYAYDIDTAGRITNVRILKDIGSGCGEAVKKAIEHYPDLWNPAMKGGKAVTSTITSTFGFNIESGNRKKRHKRKKHKQELSNEQVQ